MVIILHPDDLLVVYRAYVRMFVFILIDIIHVFIYNNSYILFRNLRISKLLIYNLYLFFKFDPYKMTEYIMFSNKQSNQIINID